MCQKILIYIILVSLSVYFQVQSGENPQVREILAVRGLFSGPPLGMRRMSVDQMVSGSPSIFHPCVMKCKRLVKPEHLSVLMADAAVHLPSALPDASPPGFPDWPAAKQPRPGAAPAGPRSLQAGPSSAE